MSSSEVDDQIARSTAMMARIADGYRDAPTRARATQAIGRRLTRIAIADVAILVAAVLFGSIVMPIGIMGALLVMALLVAATLVLALAPSGRRAPPPEKLRTLDLKTLPAQTERWLGTQRAALPPPARTLVDQIGARLDTLSPQLGKLDGETEAGLEVRRLVGEQLPAFVADYSRVPQALRQTPRNGRTPDAELIDGLRLIEREIAEMTARLAQDDLDSLATRRRYLETRYRDDAPPAD